MFQKFDINIYTELAREYIKENKVVFSDSMTKNQRKRIYRKMRRSAAKVSEYLDSCGYFMPIPTRKGNISDDN